MTAVGWIRSEQTVAIVNLLLNRRIREDFLSTFFLSGHTRHALDEFPGERLCRGDRGGRLVLLAWPAKPVSNKIGMSPSRIRSVGTSRDMINHGGNRDQSLRLEAV